jgi:amidase
MNSAQPTEVWRLGARAQAEAIRAKQVSSREVVAAHLDRMNRVNPKLNAMVNVLADQALDAADAADRQLASGATVGPLHGVPFTVKENIDVFGSPTTQGTVSLAGSMPHADSPQVAQLRKAGAIVLARSNLPEYALRWHTDNELHGPTINPWNASVTPGGSSGGEAVALATGMTPLGLGNDDGGSLRYPAQCTGIVSIKPGLGRVARALSDPTSESTISHQLLNAEGPMAREVADIRLALELLVQPNWRDPLHVPVPLARPERVISMRIARVPDSAFGKVSPQVSTGIERAVRFLEAAGCTVEEIEPPHLDQIPEVWGRMFIWDFRLVWDDMAPQLSRDTRESMESLFRLFPGVDAVAHMESFRRRLSIARDWAEFQRTYPVVLGPVSTQPPFPVGTDVPFDGLRSVVESMRLVVSANVIGIPAMVVPVGVMDGLPQAVQIIGPRYGEDYCLQVAELIEAQAGRLTPLIFDLSAYP